MSIIYLGNRESWPDVDPYKLKLFLDCMFSVNPEVRWSGSIVTTDGRFYFHLDEADRPGDLYRRCRAVFDLADPDNWHVSHIAATPEGDDYLLEHEEWYRRYRDDLKSVQGVR